MQVTNTSKALQGIHTLRGVAYVAPGDTVNLDLNQNQADAAGSLPFITLNGAVTEGELRASVTETIDVPANEVDQLREQLSASTAQIEKLTADIEAKDAEVTRLNGLLDEKEAEIEKLTAPSSSQATPPVGPFTVKETTAGWFGIFDATDTQIGKNMRSDAADTFTAMTPEEQVAFLTPAST